MNPRLARRLALPALHLLALAAVAWAAVAAAGRLDRGPAEWSAAGPLPVVGVLILQLAVLVVVWGMLLRAVSPALRAPYRLVVRSFLLGWLIRYLPGVPASAAGRYVACREAGYGPTAIAAVLFYETLLQSGAALLIPAVTVGAVLGPRWLWLGPFAGAAIGAATLAAVSPAVVRRLARRLGRFGVAGAAGFAPPPVRRLLLPLAGQALASLLAALAFHLIAVGVTPLSGSDLGHTVFSYGLAGFAGFIVPLVPSGVGVREAVLVALLGPEIGHTDALALAIVARAVPVLVDAALAVLVAISYGVDAATARRRAEAAASAAKTRA